MCSAGLTMVAGDDRPEPGRIAGGAVTAYGTSSKPGTPGTWDREVWWALNRCARVGAGTGRHRWRQVPPFDYGTLRVTASQPVPAFGVSTHGRGRLTHLPHTLLFAWRGEELAGRMVAWRCGARTAYFRLSAEPGGPVCDLCELFARRRGSEEG
jgi:hypothetical protein